MTYKLTPEYAQTFPEYEQMSESVRLRFITFLRDLEQLTYAAPETCKEWLRQNNSVLKGKSPMELIMADDFDPLWEMNLKYARTILAI